MFIIEGLLPFVSPKKYRDLVAEISQLGDNQIRTVGLVVIILGLIILFSVRG